MKIARTLALSLGLAAALDLAGCAPRPVPVTTPTPPPETPAASALSLDPGLTPPERLWHLRAALNVAALGCPAQGSAIITRYNRLLRDAKPQLAAAYRAQVAAFRGRHGDDWQPQFDRYMTGLYNRFAAPDAQPAFCPVADAIAAEALATADLTGFAGPALARIEAAFAAPPRVAARALPAPAIAAAPAAGWRIQLGAYTGRAAAEAAWARIKARQPGLAGYSPIFEAVPGKPQLVRVQIGNAGDRAAALTLCALASAGGFDCLPLRR